MAGVQGGAAQRRPEGCTGRAGLLTPPQPPDELRAEPLVLFFSSPFVLSSSSVISSPNHRQHSLLFLLVPGVSSFQMASQFGQLVAPLWAFPGVAGSHILP